ncbi:hypothetical protein [Rodentibacter trehalosifermentans]|uniref:Uncharacterized protein n=1 Tax=Rodentibacter trehalosifermentans TaxID=1908263 RepID=A0A1V3IX00_9PAST|nr:hypothetical protein [Rodentibacter trehalosifermentans]OOF46491.1 hypothetical protein BKK51_02415 [Rodentibacter trehalosifermentans]OOF49855.1 hypothetical protein BKK52_02305 [Rodentibacter trehalosifermentans]OOF52694.1 hypothetical protein BKK53_04360 [Rodentibacter trehalosifermentans]
MKKLSIDEKKEILYKLLEDYELSEHPTEEILKSMKSVFNPYRNLGSYYENHWHLIQPILKQKSWLNWLNETEREKLYYHQLRKRDKFFIHNEEEFNLLLQAQQRLMAQPEWKNKEPFDTDRIYHKLHFQGTPDFPLTFSNWKVIVGWFEHCDRYTCVYNMIKKIEGFQSYIEKNPSLTKHFVEIFRQNHYFSDWFADGCYIHDIYLHSLFLMFFSPIWHSGIEQDLLKIGNKKILEWWELLSVFSNELNVKIG